jgi:predicted PurR-regulated permease PerM
MVIVVAALYLGRQVFIPLALAVVFAFLLTPVADLLERCHLGRVPSVLMVLAVAFAFVAIVGWGVSTQVVQIMARLPDYSVNIHDKIEAARKPAQIGLGKATATVDQVSKELSSASDSAGNQRLGKSQGKQPIPVQVAAPPHSAGEYLRDIVGPLTGVLETGVIVVVFTLFILVRREDLRNRMLRLAGRSRLSVMTQAMDEASSRLRRYLLLQFAVNAGYGVLFGFGIYLIGTPHALLWGVFASVLRFVPYIGTLVAAGFPIGMALAVFPGWSQVVFTVVLFLLLELTVANFFEPWLYGAHTGISSIALLVAAIFWGMLWGPVGLILSTPLTVCLMLVGRHVPQLKFLEIMLGGEPVLSPPAHYYQRLLALDEEEAREIADEYLKTNPLGSLYDQVLVPALRLAEQDRHMNALSESQTGFIYQTVAGLIEELHESSSAAPSDAADSEPRQLSHTAMRIVCVPSRDKADEIVGEMISQLLQRSGFDVTPLAIGPVSAMLKQIGEFSPAVVCVSALPPFATGQAKSFCRELRRRYPSARIALGLWEYPGGTAKAQQRLGANSADVIATSLEQMVALIHQMNISPEEYTPQPGADLEKESV